MQISAEPFAVLLVIVFAISTRAFIIEGCRGLATAEETRGICLDAANATGMSSRHDSEQNRKTLPVTKMTESAPLDVVTFKQCHTGDVLEASSSYAPTACSCRHSLSGA